MSLYFRGGNWLYTVTVVTVRLADLSFKPRLFSQQYHGCIYHINGWFAMGIQNGGRKRFSFAIDNWKSKFTIG